MTIRRYDMRETAPDYDARQATIAQHSADPLTPEQLVQVILDCSDFDAAVLLEGAGGLLGIVRESVDRVAVFCPRKGKRGKVQAIRLKAALEAGRRTLTKPAQERPQFNTPRDCAGYLLPQFGTGNVEQFGIVVLDTKHRLVRTAIISSGSLDSCAAHPREIFREAIAAGAACIVLFHNHPSGDPTPSRDDRDLTTRLVQAGATLGIDVVDHIVLADTKYFSFREVGSL